MTQEALLGGDQRRAESRARRRGAAAARPGHVRRRGRRGGRRRGGPRRGGGVRGGAAGHGARARGERPAARRQAAGRLRAGAYRLGRRLTYVHCKRRSVDVARRMEDALAVPSFILPSL